jgi:hypothetical protein
MPVERDEKMEPAPGFEPQINGFKVSQIDFTLSNIIT